MARSSSKPQSATPEWKASPFYAQLQKLPKSDDDDRDLLRKVDIIAAQAAEIAKHVVRFLPQYTDHGERHLNNVLWFMGELAGKQNIQKLSALECALAIMAAMTHDLGMVLDESGQKAVTDSEDLPDTPEGQAWQTYRDGHSLWHAYRRLPPQERGTDRSQKMLGQVKADFIRDSHAKEDGQTGFHRILQWLDTHAKDQGSDFYTHKGLSFREGLAHLAMSHGQAIGWLPERMGRPDSPYDAIKEDRSRVYAHGPDQINWPWLAWLLRLADVMDFDASRTPRVLFESIGITDSKSRTEWKKHLSVPNPPKFGQGPDGQTLLYHCPTCPDPYTEAAVRQILGWINEEIAAVRREQDTNAKHFPEKKKLRLELPSKADVQFDGRVGGYEYLDLHFRLDRDAVMELLMGEALYGEPDLALRELVQNSLDALHLRDLRLKLQAKLHTEGPGHEPPVPVAPLNPQVEPLEVRVSWGESADPTERPWIEVADNGVGMTREVIERFLTQIGKSYYKSPDFLRERELMRRHGLHCTTISQFGIGFLSAFMLAEEIELETRAAKKDGGLEQGWSVRIHGAHGLIALYPLPNGRFTTTGTRVRLKLKADLEFEPFDLIRFRKRLKHSFYLSSRSDDPDAKAPVASCVEPAWSIARCIVWPLYPVRLIPPYVASVVLDAGFQTRELIPLDVPAIQAKAYEWRFPPGSLGEPRWQHWDWVDAETGSRIRLTLPWHTRDAVSLNAENDVPGLLRRSELLSLAEPQLPITGRTCVLVNGLLLPEWEDPLTSWLEQVDGIGGCLWLDLRGTATPRLRADRRALTSKQTVEEQVRELQRRFHTDLASRSPGADRWIRLAIGCLPHLPQPVTYTATFLGSRFSKDLGKPDWNAWEASSLLQEVARHRARLIVRDPTLQQTIPLTDWIEEDGSVYESEFSRARELETAIYEPDAVCVGLAQTMVHELTDDVDLSLNRLFAGKGSSRDLSRLGEHSTCRAWMSWRRLHLLPEGLYPSLDRAFAPWSVPGWPQVQGQLVLGGPLVLRQPPCAAPSWSDDLDLLVPLTGNPLGPLARRCPKWATDRAIRPLFTLPFMLGFAPKNWEPNASNIAEFLGVDSLLAFVPAPEHWDKAFSQIPREDFGDEPIPDFIPESVWQDAGVTALWDIRSSKVLWAEKFRTRDEMRRVGKTLKEIAGIDRGSGG